MDTLKKTFKLMVATFLLILAITSNINAQKQTRSVDLANSNLPEIPEFTLSGVWYSSQTEVEKIVLTDNGTGALLCKWYFKNGNKNEYVLQKIISSKGKNAKAFEKTVDIQNNESAINGVYEYTYGNDGRYIGTLFVFNETIIEIDEDTQIPDYYARYEWRK
ncbi:MAG TPA: hypothetical protein PKW80_01060 [Bacteroidales bacterium]|nr:hypothetical protein [Bacteroidales bacterium]